MAHEGIFATSDEIMVKAGSAVDSAGANEARINKLCLQAEAFINSQTRYNWSDVYASLNADVQGILAEAESNFVAYYLIIYNMGPYGSTAYIKFQLDLLWGRLQECIELLKTQEVKDFITSA